ncbi:T9SS type A sorting domain-containing protein [Chryseobacterium shigense]|nr:T9SS type A sorting domain-containing protein [Chryseobacterium shigense]
MKNLLISTGIPQGGTVANQKIGPLPNVKNALLQLEGSFKASIKVQSPLEIKIYPNPSTSAIAIHSNEANKLDFEIINMHGRTVTKGSVSPDEKINTSNLPAGQYIINITEGQRRVVEKFTKL